MSIQSRYRIVITVAVAIFLIVILTSRYYLVVKITGRETCKLIKVVPVIDYGLLKGANKKI